MNIKDRDIVQGVIQRGHKCNAQIKYFKAIGDEKRVQEWQEELEATRQEYRIIRGSNA